jgi:hypothetical protein
MRASSGCPVLTVRACRPKVKLPLVQKGSKERSGAENMLAHGIFGGTDIAGNKALDKEPVGFAGGSTLLGMMTIDTQIRLDHDVQCPDLRHKLRPSTQSAKIFVKAAVILEPHISIELFAYLHPLKQETKVRDSGTIQLWHRKADRKSFED